MFDRSLVTSGFDTETLLSEGYLTYLLLAQVEAGRLPLELTITNTQTGQPVHVRIHPPTDYARRYEPHPDAPAPPAAQTGSLAIRLLPDGDEAFCHLLAWVTVTDESSGQTVGPVPAGLLVDMSVQAEVSDAGFESDHHLRLSLVGLDSTTSGALQNQGIDPAEVERAIRAQLNRDIPLGVAQGGQVHRVRMRKFVTDEQRSLGVYVDLALRTGPEPGAFVEPRGDVESAQDFRPPGAPLAFATSPGLFALLGPDVKARQAEPTEDGDGFRYPIREDMTDPESDEIGRIKGIRIGPEMLGIPPVTTGRLMIDVHGEYTDALGDPDFHLQILLRPTVTDGVVDWDLDVDVDLGLLATLLLVAAGIGLTLLFGPALGWGSTLVIGTLVGLAVLKGLIAEPLAAKLIEDRMDEDTQASFLDALPFRVPATHRRWDPFYDTQHQIVGLVESASADIAIDSLGIAFQAGSLSLDKEPVPVDHAVVRDEERSGGDVTALRYRIAGFNSLAADLAAIAPGTDRMPYSRADAVADPDLVSLTNDQIAERIPTRRLLAPITYTAERIHLVEGQIDALLCLSRREREEQRRAVIARFRQRMFAFIADEYGDQIREDVTDQLREDLGREPTPQEVTEAFNAHINRVIDGLMPGFELDLLPGQLEAAVARTLRFDLAPEELIAQQLAGVLILDGKEIIVRHNADGTETPYYRDHPDADPRDNLLALPPYTPPYVPPA